MRFLRARCDPAFVESLGRLRLSDDAGFVRVFVSRYNRTRFEDPPYNPRVALTPGTRLGPYEISTLIGAGGMGEVYAATDVNLARQVAIKVLPDAVAADADRLARFEREARTLASLNHPNIAVIYGIERTGGTTRW